MGPTVVERARDDYGALDPHAHRCSKLVDGPSGEQLKIICEPDRCASRLSGRSHNEFAPTSCRDSSARSSRPANTHESTMVKVPHQVNRAIAQLQPTHRT